MSVTVSTVDQISRSQVNTSGTKQCFSFSRDTRFKYPKPDDFQRSYELPSDFSKKWKTLVGTFGVPRPDIFYNKEVVNRPSPFEYSLPSSFKMTPREPKIKSRNGRPQTAQSHTFGASRNCYAKVVSCKDGQNYEGIDPALPGPGYYSPR